MSGSVLVCAMLATGAAPVPPVPANQAPPPRLVRPDISLIVIEMVFGSGGAPNRTRLHSLGFRGGKMMPPELVWEGEEEYLSANFSWHTLVADRFLVTERGTVIDLRTKKEINGEREAVTVRAEETRAVYTKGGPAPAGGLFAFEYATGTIVRIGNVPPRPWADTLLYPDAFSPDRTKAVRWEKWDELVLRRDGEKPKSLGKGFKMEVDPEWARKQVPYAFKFPVLWLDDDTFLTQHDHGKLATVDLAGKVTDVVTIEDAPKQTLPELTRDRSGAVFYSMAGEHYRIDLAKKTAEKSAWYGLGHGFEASWKRSDELGYKLRHNGKEIGQLHCWPHGAKTAPGHLAVVMDDGKERWQFAPRWVAVWSEATGEWTSLKYKHLSPDGAIGWVK